MKQTLEMEQTLEKNNCLNNYEMCSHSIPGCHIVKLII